MVESLGFVPGLFSVYTKHEGTPGLIPGFLSLSKQIKTNFSMGSIDTLYSSAICFYD